MTLDPHKELKISYNFLNLPRLMSKHGQAVLATVYDATGRKWRAVRSIQPLGQNNQPTGQHQIETTTYLGGVEWKQAGGEPTRLHAVNASAHGRTAFTVDEATGETRSRLEYYHTDHLGNVRLAFSDLDGNGTITVGDIYAPDNEVVMEQHYYPFGLAQNGPWFATVHPDNAYRYNGKELDEAAGMYDYGARYYDPAIARWGQVDPLAEGYAAFSPYNYVMNRPINAIDPDGRQVKITNEDDQGYFMTELRNVIGDAANLFSFNKNGFLKIDGKGVNKLEDGNVKDIVSGFQEVAKDDAIIEFTTQTAEDGSVIWNPEIIVANGDSGTSQPAFEGDGYVFDFGPEGAFVSKDFTSKKQGTSGVRGLVAIDRTSATSGTFSSDGDKKTTPCAGCIIIHEFLDHGLNYIKSGYNQRRTDGVEYHNKALIIKESPVRNGADHNNH